MATKPRIPMYDWQVKPKRARYVKEHRCIDCGKQSETFRCDECHRKVSEYSKLWRSKNIERNRLNAKLWREKNPDKTKKTNKIQRAKSYDMTLDEYELALLQPCGICGTTEKNRGIDHCHVTNKVRGTLCIVCNAKLGWYENNKNAIDKWLMR